MALEQHSLTDVLDIGTKLEKTGLPLEQILRIAVFKGMTKDTINCFVCCGNKYSDALRKIKVA